MIRILIVDNQAGWHQALSKSFELVNLFDRFTCSVENVDSCKSVKKALANNDYDLVIVTDVLNTTLEYPVYEGLHIINYINNNYSYIYKILINNCELESQKTYYNMFKEYKVDNSEIFVKTKINVKKLTDAVILLLQMMERFTNGYGLLIGVGYRNSSRALPVTVSDAKKLRELLTNPRLAAYPREQVQVFTEEISKKDNILAGLDALANQVKENPEATVWIYYSGHGLFCEQTQEYFLIPYGYSLQEIKKTSISSQEWSQKIQKIQAKKLMVWLDCCHAGGMLSKELDGLPFRESPPPKGILEGLASGAGRVVIASCKEKQKSYILPGATNSVFTTCLLEVLQGQGLTDSNDEYIRFFQIMSYLYKKVPELVKTKPQNPILVSGEGIDDNFAVCCRPRKGVAIDQSGEPAGQTDTKREANFETNKIGTTSDSLSQILKNQLQDLCSQLSLLNQKIGKLERAKIINANPLLEFDIEQNISKLKEDRKSLEIEIEDLNRRLSESRSSLE
ncbi:MAG: putative protein containing caspase domain [Phormidium sp. OSCR]|nr:MAG: putative protein containing caspase domain [Phormidium sp. OSCR]